MRGRSILRGSPARRPTCYLPHCVAPFTSPTRRASKDQAIRGAACTTPAPLPISVQGVAALPTLTEPAPSQVDAISGGTGMYAGVRGEVRLETRSNKVTSTFHFID